MRCGSRCVIVMGSLLACLAAGMAGAQDKARGQHGDPPREGAADKKVVVASVLALTESEAKVFWPGLQRLSRRHGQPLRSGPQAHRHLRQGVRHDDRRDGYDVAQPGLALERDHVRAAQFLRRPLPKRCSRPKRSRACNQVENKIRALVNYELARDIPFVK